MQGKNSDWLQQRVTERSVLGILLPKNIWSKVIEEQSRGKDMTTEYCEQEFYSAGS